MTRKELFDLHKAICDSAFETLKAKNSDYACGSDPFANFNASIVIDIDPKLGLLMRCLDKMKRLQTFIVKHELQVKGESVSDSIQDIINYMVLLQGMINDESAPSPTN